METKNSRIITYPSTVENKLDHSVVIVDASDDDIAKIGLFLAGCQKNYDVYLYEGHIGDLEWLNHIGSTADIYLINDISEVKISINGIRYGQGLSLSDPLEYFQKIEQISVDTNLHKML